MRDDRVLPETRVLGSAIVPFLLVAFALLYFFPDDTRHWFAWDVQPTITPLIMGAGYWSGRRTSRSSATDEGVRPRRLAAMSLHLFAGLRVRDYQAARRWYERLLGEPTFFPHDTEAVWTLADDRSVYVVEHAEGAGSSVVTIWVDDLDAHVSAIAARGLEPDERETYANGVRKTVYRDPDGNEVAFAGASVSPRDRSRRPA